MTDSTKTKKRHLQDAQALRLTAPAATNSWILTAVYTASHRFQMSNEWFKVIKPNCYTFHFLWRDANLLAVSLLNDGRVAKSRDARHTGNLRPVHRGQRQG